jgi:hypothetical protein
MNKKTKLSYLFGIALSLVFGCASFVAFAKNDNAKSKAQGRSKTVNIKNFEKADSVKGTTNAQIHKDKSEKVAKTLQEVADEQKTAGNTEVSDQIQQVVAEQEQTQAQTTDAIAQVETRGKVKTFLFGTDYKNLGQLRSSLVHNRNEIRKLTQTLTQIQTPEQQALIEAQLATLTQERERIKTIITTNESGFSLFGWVSRFLNNYEQTPINDQEEAQLTDEVENAIDNTATDTTATTTATGTTDTTGTTGTTDTTTTGTTATDTTAIGTTDTTATAATVPVL